MKTGSYLSKFHISHTTENQSLIGEIIDWSDHAGKKLNGRQIGIVAGAIKLKGKYFVRECFEETKKANGKRPVGLLLHKLGETKVKLYGKQ